MNTRYGQGAVVVGVDGSAHSELALDWATRRAEAEHRPLVIMHAAGAPPAIGNTAEARSQQRIRGRRVTDAALGHVRQQAPDLDVRVVMKMDDARAMLLGASSRTSLMVLGSRGRGAIGSLLLGSVSVAVAERAGCPVVVVRDSVNPDTGHIVVGVDGSPASRAAVETAFAEASRAGRPLTVMHADPLEGWSDRVPLIRDADSEARLLAAEVVAGYQEKYPDVTVTVTVVSGDPAPVLARESMGAALIVVGSRGRGTASALLLGSTSRYVIEHARCTVLVAR